MPGEERVEINCHNRPYEAEKNSQLLSERTNSTMAGAVPHSIDLISIVLRPNSLDLVPQAKSQWATPADPDDASIGAPLLRLTLLNLPLQSHRHRHRHRDYRRAVAYGG